MWRPGALCLLAAALAAGPVGARAQANDPRVGRRVFTRYGTVLRVGSRVVDDGRRGLNQARGQDKAVFNVYQVKQSSGDWLWLVPEGGGPSGWAPAGSVVPIDQAIGHFTEAIRAEPTKAENYVGRGLVWLETGETSIAIADFTEAIRLDPGNDVPYQNRGRAWAREGRFDKAIADFNEAARIDPKDALTFKNRGAAYRETKEYANAIADFDAAIRLDPQDAEARLNRAWAEAAVKAYDRAWDDFNEAIRLEPTDGFYYNNRAWFGATCPDPKYRDGKRAVATATRACELGGWKDAHNLGTLAAACAEAGDFDAAVRWQEQAQALYTDPADRRDGLARLELYRQRKPYHAPEGA